MGRGYYWEGPSIARRPKQDEENAGEIDRDNDGGKNEALTVPNSQGSDGDVIVQIQHAPGPRHHPNASYTEKSKLDANPFLRDIDATSHAYLSLLRRYGGRQNQGRDVQYKGFSKAMSAKELSKKLFAVPLSLSSPMIDPTQFRLILRMRFESIWIKTRRPSQRITLLEPPLDVCSF